MSQHAQTFAAALTDALPSALARHDEMVSELVALRERRGRLFCLGVGGGAANAAHAVNDFRKLCGIEAYAPTDGIAELTARANDEGWETIFVGWLRCSNFGDRDAIMVFSVGGGTSEVSVCIYQAVALAAGVGARVLGAVGRSDGAAASAGDVVSVVECPGPLRTPITEALQLAVLHALVSDPRLQRAKTKW